MDRACWCCGKGTEAKDSPWACPQCEAHGAWRGVVPGLTFRQAQRDLREKD
jgi:Zn finger protein HypA/HybF involved in hydrogenase expression